MVEEFIAKITDYLKEHGNKPATLTEILLKVFNKNIAELPAKTLRGLKELMRNAGFEETLVTVLGSQISKWSLPDNEYIEKAIRKNKRKESEKTPNVRRGQNGPKNLIPKIMC